MGIVWWINSHPTSMGANLDDIWNRCKSSTYQSTKHGPQRRQVQPFLMPLRWICMQRNETLTLIDSRKRRFPISTKILSGGGGRRIDGEIILTNFGRPSDTTLGHSNQNFTMVRKTKASHSGSITWTGETLKLAKTVGYTPELWRSSSFPPSRRFISRKVMIISLQQKISVPSIPRNEELYSKWTAEKRGADHSIHVAFTTLQPGFPLRADEKPGTDVCNYITGPSNFFPITQWNTIIRVFAIHW